MIIKFRCVVCGGKEIARVETIRQVTPIGHCANYKGNNVCDFQLIKTYAEKAGNDFICIGCGYNIANSEEQLYKSLVEWGMVAFEQFDAIDKEAKIERSYCQVCRKEIPTESGILCVDCQNKAKDLLNKQQQEIPPNYTRVMPVRKNVHTEHCCINCGCKYGDEDCPVVSGVLRQTYPCGGCDSL